MTDIPNALRELAEGPTDGPWRIWCMDAANEIDRLRAALERYGGHEDGCEGMAGALDPRCTCGFRVALAGGVIPQAIPQPPVTGEEPALCHRCNASWNECDCDDVLDQRNERELEVIGGSEPASGAPCCTCGRTAGEELCLVRHAREDDVRWTRCKSYPACPCGGEPWPTTEADQSLAARVDVVEAQHDETGRLWFGPRHALPPRYKVIGPSDQPAAAPASAPPAPLLRLTVHETEGRLRFDWQVLADHLPLGEIDLYAAPASTAPANDALDAARYRWLREHTVATGLSQWMGRHQFLDAAVDAARDAVQPPAPRCDCYQWVNGHCINCGKAGPDRPIVSRYECTDCEGLYRNGTLFHDPNCPRAAHTTPAPHKDASAVCLCVTQNGALVQRHANCPFHGVR